MDYRICVISTHSELTKLAKQVFREQKKRFQVIQAVLDSAVAMARELAPKGVEVFVTTMGNAVCLREQTDIPVVSVPADAFDVLYTLYQTRSFDPLEIAQFHYRQKHPRMQDIERILRFSPRHFIFNSQGEIEGQLKEASSMGVQIIVGGGFVCEAARQAGLEVVPIKIGKGALQHALAEAEEVAALRRKERAETMKFKAVLNYAHEGIVATDDQTRVTVFNPAAERIFGISAIQVLGRPVCQAIPQCKLDKVAQSGQSVLDEVKKVGETAVVSNRVPIIDGGRVVGVVANFQEVARIQEIEQSIRKFICAKEYVAKFHFEDIIGVSHSMRKAVDQARKFGATEETILITGESGCGKELFAGSIHNISCRQHGPFLAVNCAAIPPNLLESELFGYSEGAFTGAKRGGKPGLFELAHRGTLFLDEIGEIPNDIQAKLLRVIQEKEIRRVGDDKFIPVDVRIVAATNVNLYQAMQKGQFRPDLYYRINVLHVQIPPLRMRNEDIPHLVGHFLEKLAPSLENKLKADIIQLLGKDFKNYYWPGNVRELENILRRIVVLVKDGDQGIKEVRELLVEYFNGLINENNNCAGEDTISVPLRGNLQDILDKAENQAITEFYYRFHGNKAELAKILGIGRTTLWRKLNNLGIE
ncbi:MAG: sigma 54-interacting transcriptional regulator [Bacillota bacterium]